MSRESITFTKPNEEWLRQQVESEECNSKSWLVNDLIRQARNQQKELNCIRLKLEKAEKRLYKEGFVNQTCEEILAEFKDKLKK